MEIKEIEKSLRQYQKYYDLRGVDERLIDAMCQASEAAYGTEDADFILEVCRKTRNYIREFIKKSSGGTFEILEAYAQEKKQYYTILTKYYAVLRLEARYSLDSFCLYMERHRARKDRFYEPRRKVLKQFADAIEDLEYDRLDELYLHMPPRTGKLIADDTPVMTSKGWKKHGDLKVGDKVIGSNGKFIRVKAIHPKDVADYAVYMTNGEVIKCHGRHEWTLDNYQRGRVTYETERLAGLQLCKENTYSFRLPEKKVVEIDAKLAICPYTLGNWLADDPRTSNTALNDFKIIMDSLIERETEFDSHSAYSDLDFGGKLAFHGLDKSLKPSERFIPYEYILAPKNVKLELLAGIVDRCGTFSVNSKCRYTVSTASERLKDDIISLISSMNWLSTSVEQTDTAKSNGKLLKNCYNITFVPTETVPVATESKLITDFRQKWNVNIAKIEKCDPVPGRCITVSAKDGLYAVGRTMQLTHNSQLTTFATVWHCARDDEKSNLYVTYKNSLGGAFLAGALELIRDSTYTFNEVFPEEKIANTDLEAQKMNLGRRKKYTTLSGKGMDAGLNGEYDASGWLILDDLHEGIQDVLNPERLTRAQSIFDNNVLTRKKAGCKILGIGTIWSNNDLFSDREEFLTTNPKAKKLRVKIIKIPALNENDLSNFDYDYGVGFSTEDYQLTRAKFENNGDLASWAAQFMQEPIEREGALFRKEDLKFYNGVLPAEEPVRITCACDVALGGEDYLSLPIAYVYEDGSVYIDDVVFDNSEKKITKPQVVEKMIYHNVGSGFFEANQGGEGYKDEVMEELTQRGIKINLTSKYAPTDKRKEQRIWDKAGSIRDFYFRDETCRNSQYQKFMHNLYNFNFRARGKKVHQDAPDSLATLAAYLEGSWENAKAKAAFNPFRRRGI